VRVRPARRGRASFSRDGLYRYRLHRRWSDGPRVAWVMLNPSTADAAQDDPTIRRCIDFSQRWGFGSLTVVNLFAWRSPVPEALLRVEDPVGPRTPAVLGEVIRGADAVVAAWGNLHPALVTRTAPSRASLPPSALCLGLTARGEPRHPLYVPGDTSPRLLREPAHPVR
jgi:hypothetical protein